MPVNWGYALCMMSLVADMASSYGRGQSLAYV